MIYANWLISVKAKSNRYANTEGSLSDPVTTDPKGEIRLKANNTPALAKKRHNHGAFLYNRFYRW